MEIDPRRLLLSLHRSLYVRNAKTSEAREIGVRTAAMRQPLPSTTVANNVNNCHDASTQTPGWIGDEGTIVRVTNEYSANDEEGARSALISFKISSAWSIPFIFYRTYIVIINNEDNSVYFKFVNNYLNIMQIYIILILNIVKLKVLLRYAVQIEKKVTI